MSRRRSYSVDACRVSPQGSEGLGRSDAQYIQSLVEKTEEQGRRIQNLQKENHKARAELQLSSAARAGEASESPPSQQPQPSSHASPPAPVVLTVSEASIVIKKPRTPRAPIPSDTSDSSSSSSCDNPLGGIGSPQRPQRISKEVSETSSDSKTPLETLKPKKPQALGYEGESSSLESGSWGGSAATATTSPLKARSAAVLMGTGHHRKLSCEVESTSVTDTSSRGFGSVTSPLKATPTPPTLLKAEPLFARKSSSDDSDDSESDSDSGDASSPPSPLREKAMSIRHLLSPKRRISTAADEAPNPHYVPSSDLLSRVMGASMPRTNSNLQGHIDSDESDSAEFRESSLAGSEKTQKKCSLSPKQESTKNGRLFDFEQWVTARVSQSDSADTLSEEEVIERLTQTEERTPTHDDFKRHCEDAVQNGAVGAGAEGAGPTAANVVELLSCLRGVLNARRDALAEEDARTRRGVDLLMRNLRNCLDRFEGPDEAHFSDISARDYQQLRTLEGALHMTVHNLNTDDPQEVLDTATYRAALVRQQKVLIRQKWYILVNPHLRTFYMHLTTCLRAVFLLLRALRYHPLDIRSLGLSRQATVFHDYLMQTLPYAERLFQCRQSVAQLAAPRKFFADFSLAHIDDAVDAVALTLCKKHEQQLGMLTYEGLSRHRGCIAAGDYVLATIIESIRHGNTRDDLPLADQVAVWVGGRTLQMGDAGTSRQQRVHSVSDPLDPALEEAGKAGLSLPLDGIVATAPPSDHLRWKAEGLFRFCGIRTLDGDTYGFVDTTDDSSYELYGFALDTPEAARDCGMERVDSLLWGAQSPTVWRDDVEFVGLNPVLFMFASPLTYTLLACQEVYPLAQGGFLLGMVEPELETTARKRSRTLGLGVGWNSRTAAVKGTAAAPRKKRGLWR